MLRSVRSNLISSFFSSCSFLTSSGVGGGGGLLPSLSEPRGFSWAEAEAKSILYMAKRIRAWMPRLRKAAMMAHSQFMESLERGCSVGATTTLRGAGRGAAACGLAAMIKVPELLGGGLALVGSSRRAGGGAAGLGVARAAGPAVGRPAVAGGRWVFGRRHGPGDRHGGGHGPGDRHLRLLGRRGQERVHGRGGAGGVDAPPDAGVLAAEPDGQDRQQHGGAGQHAEEDRQQRLGPVEQPFLPFGRRRRLGVGR